MGCYGIGNTRLMGTIVEVYHDDKGIIWPINVAPYHVHIVSLGKDDEVKSAAEKLYKDLQKSGVEVLYDNRNDSPGVKLNDADLIGIPLRLVISKRTLENNGVEWKERAKNEAADVKFSELNDKVKKFLSK